MRHLIHREWQTTHCGQNPIGLEMTSTPALVSCRECSSVYQLLQDIQTAEPAAWEDSL